MVTAAGGCAVGSAPLRRSASGSCVRCGPPGSAGSDGPVPTLCFQLMTFS